MKTKAVLLDDEPRSIEMLEWLLETYCPEVEVVARFQSPEKALAEIPRLNLDVLFCDIAMPVLNGFDFLLALGEWPFSVIFVTAHNGIVQKALKNSHLEFLLKPVDNDELSRALQKLGKTKTEITREKLLNLREMLPR